jgi:DNA-binding Lrp family transcriptional regulator
MLEIPLTTVQRRRRRLESEFLTTTHQIRIEKLGWRKAQLLISTVNGVATRVGKTLLSTCPEVLSVNRSVGEHTIDLMVEIVFRNNKELAGIIDRIKAMEGVKDVAWSEVVEEIGKNYAGQGTIIGKL